MRVLARAALLLACCVWVSRGQAQSSQANTSNNQGSQSSSSSSNSNMPSTSANASSSSTTKQRSIWDEPIRFGTKAKDACTMVVSGQGDFTKLRVSCKNKGKSYWCDFLGKPNHCRAYNNNPRHYFTQIMWEMRKLPNACQGHRAYKPPMCKGANDDTQMVFHTSWPKMTTARPAHPSQDRQQQQQQQQPQQPQQPGKPTTTTKAPVQKPQKPQQAKPLKPQQTKPAGKPSQPKKPMPKPKSATAKPTTYTDSKASKLAQEYCWKSFQGICAYFIGWFQN